MFYDVYCVENTSPLLLGDCAGFLHLTEAASSRAQLLLTRDLFELSSCEHPPTSLLLDPPIAPLAVDGLDPQFAARWDLIDLSLDPDVQSGLADLLAAPDDQEGPDFEFDHSPGPFDAAASLDDDPLLAEPDDSDFLDVDDVVALDGSDPRVSSTLPDSGAQ